MASTGADGPISSVAAAAPPHELHPSELPLTTVPQPSQPESYTTVS
jgi:hypothetical protein